MSRGKMKSTFSKHTFQNITPLTTYTSPIGILGIKSLRTQQIAHTENNDHTVVTESDGSEMSSFERKLNPYAEEILPHYFHPETWNQWTPYNTLRSFIIVMYCYPVDGVIGKKGDFMKVTTWITGRRNSCMVDRVTTATILYFWILNSRYKLGILYIIWYSFGIFRQYCTCLLDFPLQHRIAWWGSIFFVWIERKEMISTSALKVHIIFGHEVKLRQRIISEYTLSHEIEVVSSKKVASLGFLPKMWHRYDY